jgi:hypothetical protein
MSTEVTTRKNTTLDRLICNHGMPSPASCADCMDEGVFLPAAARRSPAGHPAAGTVALKKDCGVQAVTNALGIEYMEAAEALLAAGWTPGTGTPIPTIIAAVESFGFTATWSPMTLSDAARDGGTFIVIGYRGRRCHAWTIEAGRRINALGWERPGLRYRVLRIAA